MIDSISALFTSFPEEGSGTRRALASPEVIDGRYRVLGRLGSGSMGAVLRAEDLFLRRPVAIKLVDAGTQGRFLKEAQALASVRHENVVQVYSYGPLGKEHYLAMELVIGQPLDEIIDRLAGDPMPLARAMGILRAVAQGLDAVHARRLVHRDVKPGNIIVERTTDRPVLIDFGLARRHSASNPQISVGGGTPVYMAPEQMLAQDAREVSARADVYAFAGTAFELMTGRTVFERNDLYGVLLAHVEEPPRRISSLRPELVSVDRVFARALAKSPADRHASAGEMVRALEHGLGFDEPLRAEAPSSAVVAPSVLVLSAAAEMRRSLVRTTFRALRSHGVDMPCESAASALEAATFIESSNCRLFVVDEESSAGRLVELAARVRQRRDAEIIVVSRDLEATTASLRGTGVRHLVPKPVNVHVLEAVLGRLRVLSPEHRAFGGSPADLA